MKQIMLINPSKKRPKSRSKSSRQSAITKGTGKKMAKKRKKTVRRRRNPSKKSSSRRTIARRASRTIAGLNVMGALKNSLPLTLGMMGSKFFAKRFGGGASEIDPESWTWRSYLQMAGGAFATGVVANMIKRGTGQKCLEGGISLLAYELMQNELIQGSEFASEWLGEDETDEPFIYGDDGSEIPLDDTYRMQLDLPEYSEMEGALEPVSQLGDVTAIPNQLGSVRDDLGARYRKFYF